MMDGGWTLNPEFLNPELSGCNLPQSVASAFCEATDLDGAGYVPLLYVASQVVQGMNYMLICRRTLVLRTPVINVVQITIHDPLPVEREHGAKAIILEQTLLA